MMDIEGFGEYERMGWAVASTHATPKELYRADVTDRRVLAELLETFEHVREALGGKPITIKSGRRSKKYQEWLIAHGFRAAKISAHVYGAALDLATPHGMKDADFARAIFKAAEELGFPPPRVGYIDYRTEKYKNAPWVHFDFAFLLLQSEVDQKIPDSWKKSGMIF